jgi:DNA polymerase III delta' subunit
MNWDDLVGQQPAKQYLRAVLSAGRLAHAFLFKGAPGVGKRTAARIFAKALLCERPRDGAACGECRACHRFDAGTHADMIPLKKIADSGVDAGEVGDHEQIIRLGTIQYVCEQLHRSPMAGGRRVVIIPEAQRFCRGQAEAANAFLKTLEEPPASAAIILTTSQPEGLLETIVSRVQAVQFRRLSAEEIRTGLARRAASRPAEDREVAAALADGSLGRALELLDGDLRQWRAQIAAGLERLSAQTALQFGVSLWTLADAEGQRLFAAAKAAGRETVEDESDDEDDAPSEGQVKSAAGWKRYVFRRELEVCEVCFRDALVCASAGDAGQGLLLQPDQAKLSARLAKLFGQDGCQKALAALSQSLLATRLYVRGDVIGRALAGRLVAAMAGSV